MSIGLTVMSKEILTTASKPLLMDDELVHLVGSHLELQFLSDASSQDG